MLGRDYFNLILACGAGLLAMLTPAICLSVAPRKAAPCHAVLSLLVSVVGLVAGMVAAGAASATFWLLPVLFITSQGLLHRRLQTRYGVAVAAAVAIVACIILAVFFVLSL